MYIIVYRYEGGREGGRWDMGRRMCKRNMWNIENSKYQCPIECFVWCLGWRDVLVSLFLRTSFVPSLRKSRKTFVFFFSMSTSQRCEMYGPSYSNTEGKKRSYKKLDPFYYCICSLVLSLDTIKQIFFHEQHQDIRVYPNNI